MLCWGLLILSSKEQPRGEQARPALSFWLLMLPPPPLKSCAWLSSSFLRGLAAFGYTVLTIVAFSIRPPRHLRCAPRCCTYDLCLFFRSVTACNSPLNGSLLVYSLGARTEKSPAVRVGSHGHLLSVAIHAVELLDWAILRSVFDPRYGRQGSFLGACVLPGVERQIDVARVPDSVSEGTFLEFPSSASAAGVQSWYAVCG